MKNVLFIVFCLISLPVFADSEWAASDVQVDKPIDIKVYRNPDCQCCHKWMTYLEDHGFHVIDQPTHNLDAIKEKLGVPSAMHSCHTAVVDGYAIEGHVPAEDIMRLLTQKPDITGLAVPQMPVGTPGMEMGLRKDNFAVIEFNQAQQYSIFTTYQVDKNHQYQASTTEE
ncbi:hypothetical protein GCM10007891_17160 [Methylophaga thalassica]|jgi:hypothetical protein|uniref:DUF411 domain-containing protein n=1 Tax=Methylophaga thalassica TaxID=40223 RepID=A0ABQ5TWB9_9GAMM|nr:DUF411 domain-containing protein [Methylophaga thalassica]GLP99862.1 hypothetical protein GCM10007891_17160 [Methylophaga thalassica]